MDELPQTSVMKEANMIPNILNFGQIKTVNIVSRSVVNYQWQS